MTYSTWRKYEGRNLSWGEVTEGTFHVSTVITGCSSYGLIKCLQLLQEDNYKMPLAIFTKGTEDPVLKITNDMPEQVEISDCVIFAAACLYGYIPQKDN